MTHEPRYFFSTLWAGALALGLGMSSSAIAMGLTLSDQVIVQADLLDGREDQSIHYFEIERFRELQLREFWVSEVQRPEVPFSIKVAFDHEVHGQGLVLIEGLIGFEEGLLISVQIERSQEMSLQGFMAGMIGATVEGAATGETVTQLPQEVMAGHLVEAALLVNVVSLESIID